MPAVPESWLKGNYGASVVMARLSSECLVRPVAVDTDVGVDMYCETVTEGRPFLHFWLQVKAGDQCHVDSSSTYASCRFQRDHIEYWARQPVPVFAALVPTAWPAQCEPHIYIVDITTWILFNREFDPHDSFTLRSDHHWPPGDRKSVRAFLRTEVPKATARLQVSRGVVAHAPTPTPQYVQTIPLVPVTQFKDRILLQLRRTAAYSILFTLGPTALEVEDREFVHLLARLVEQFGDDPHWENFMARAVSSHIAEDYASALAMYARAKAGIEGDHRVSNDPSWRETIRSIERLEECARRQQPPEMAG
jgi:Domain of unknown function (DUF4365)